MERRGWKGGGRGRFVDNFQRGVGGGYERGGRKRRKRRSGGGQRYALEHISAIKF